MQILLDHQEREEREPSEKMKILYQKKGRDLQRWDFRPDNVSWHLLTEFSRAYGISRCLFFVRMLLLEAGLSSDEQENQGVPTGSPKKYCFNVLYIQFKEKLWLEHDRYRRGLAEQH